jgi:hypothetical protein
VIEKRNAGPDGRFSRAVQVQFETDASFFGVAIDLRRPFLHVAIKQIGG